jgi:uncharacterized peroxidase-related enzyme
MARVREIGIDEVPQDLKALYRRFTEDYGAFGNQVAVFAQRPPALRHVMGLLLDLADEALVPKRMLEIVLVVVSRLNACTYCVAHHAPRLVETGLPTETVDRILEPDCPGLDPVERLVRDYAQQVTLDARRVPDRLFAALREHFSEAQMVELTLRIALCGFFNRFNDAMRIGIEDAAMAEALATGVALDEAEERSGAEHAL